MTTAVRADYLSAHIFYNVRDLRAVVLGCVDPLIERLKRKELISGFFFIRYWEGGNHVRLRVLPTSPSDAEAVRAEVDKGIFSFLRDQPSMLDPNLEEMRAVIRSLYEFEHGAEAFKREYPTQEIPVYPNNSYQYIPYAPEYGRYGGAIGVSLAHQNFAISSDIAIQALRDNNVRMHANVLGLAFQLTLNFAFAFFRTRQETARFFDHFVDFFSKLEMPARVADRLDQCFAIQSEQIIGYVDQLEVIHERLMTGEEHHFGRYIRHAHEMRDTILQAYQAGDLQFSFSAPTARDALFMLVTSYIHMTNNRLGLLIFEETYIAGMISKALYS